MSNETKLPAAYMAAEIAEAPMVFANAVKADATKSLTGIDFDAVRAIYTIARGSSDAAANILSYLFMRHLKRPVTSLPPSAFSIYGGVDMQGALGLVISQSGASDDLVSGTKGVRASGGQAVAITNQPASPVEAAANATIPMNAGPEKAVPATKSVIGSVAAGMSLLAALVPQYRAACETAAEAMEKTTPLAGNDSAELKASLLRARDAFVIGRGAGYGAAQEIALKLKETCALHAEAYSASEVLHGPLQLATNPLFVLIVDTGEPETQASLNKAEDRFRDIGADVFRLRPSGAENLCPAAAASIILYLMYPIILETTLALGLDPDCPETLAKVTRTS